VLGKGWAAMGEQWVFIPSHPLLPGAIKGWLQARGTLNTHNSGTRRARRILLTVLESQ